MNKSKSTIGGISARLILSVAVGMFFMFTALMGNTEGQSQDDFCSQTARSLFDACKTEVKAEAFKKTAICLNISNPQQRRECFDEIENVREESMQLCREQRSGRLEACKSLGEARYDPDINPAFFDSDFTNLTKPNPYFPLRIGNQWEYRGGNEVNKLEVLNQTKLIAGVRCVVVRDQVFKNGDLAENTDDWFAQAKDGNVWYFGEEVKDYQSFSGDTPRNPELVSIDGSFKWGHEGDKGGLFFFFSPKVGDAYLEEFSLANAEDVTIILSSTYRFGSNAELDQLVPRPLAERFCAAGDCVVTKNFSLLEPGIFARKYYARGIGVFLEVKPETATAVQIVDCNFDPRCVNLPRP